MMGKFWKLVLALFCVSLWTAGAAYAAQWANPGLLVDAATVKANIDKPDWVVVDCRDLKDYLEGHIPGAISLGKRGKSVVRDATARVYQDVSIYEKLFGLAGIGNNTHVVFYHGDLKTLNDATVPFWVMEYLGHDKAHVLDGGLDAWRKAGNRLDKTPTKKAPTTFKANVVKSRIATTQEILEIANGNGAGTQLIDSRSKEEHLGTEMRALQGGHVPNTTKHVSHVDTLLKVKDPKTDKMTATHYLSYDAAVKGFGSLDKKKRTVGYCQTGTRSTLTYLQLRLLGFENPANWDDSWRVYGSDLHAANPIEALNGPQFYNFDKVNKSLKNLDKKVKALEEQVKKLGGGK
jgi:thiosulfate/3-mercaptopyruvate sulfurtransferase